jgi:hypothetical protein
MVKPFFVADLNATGEQQLLAEYSYSQLEQLPIAAELITILSTLLWRNPDEFETPIPNPNVAISLRWLSTAPTTGLLTLRHSDQLASLSLLASGKDPQADHVTFQSFQTHLLRQLHDTGHEPAFGLMDLRPRPLIATVNFSSPQDDAARLTIALADRSFAAAYFRQQGLC